MIRFYVAFDDTDTVDCGRGTGKLARWFNEELPAECKPWAVVRQQLLNDPAIPKTSHNSSLCCIIDAPDESYRQVFIEKGIGHVRKHYFEGSDPGLCVASESDPDLESLVDFGLKCTASVVSQRDAIEAAASVYLKGLGGTNDGIIGAAAAVGLTVFGESGRLVAYRDIRDLPQLVSAGELRKRDILPQSANRHAEYIPDHHSVDTLGSLRPHLNGKRLVIPVLAAGEDTWKVIDTRKEGEGS